MRTEKSWVELKGGRFLTGGCLTATWTCVRPDEIEVLVLKLFRSDIEYHSKLLTVSVPRKGLTFRASVLFIKDGLVEIDVRHVIII